jgi:molybdenum cofactor cytidylyltransferase
MSPGEHGEPGPIAAVVLAAGAGRRFGGRKQLALLRGRPLLEHALAVAAAGPASRTLVVLGADADEVEAGIDLGGGTRVVRCPDWRLGQGASLGVGLRALGAEVSAALVTLGDEPFLSAEAARRLVAARRADRAALRAGYDGRPGHPVLIERRLFQPLAALAPGANPAEYLRQAGVETIECGDLGDPGDVDTLDQLVALERSVATGDCNL